VSSIAEDDTGDASRLADVCGRFSQQRPASELAEIFAAEPLAEELGPRFNVAPTDDALVVVQRDERRAITAYRWGLIPHWADSAKVGSRMFNARAETLTASPAFRDALRHKRCLIPVDGFYEWKREATRRQPFLIARSDGRPLALAGLWSGWRDPSTDRVIRTFTIVTAGPNAQVADLHDRMPVLVPEEAWSTWLDPRLDDPAELHCLLRPNEDVDLRILAVSQLVNDVRNDGPKLIEPAPDDRWPLEIAVAGPGLFD
jgi:putative SOS response-associated peptidase YedK